MNHSDSERMASFFEGRGVTLTASIETASVVVINTCGIRQAAENRVYSQVHNLRKVGNNCTIILTGCIAHRKDVQQRLRGKVDVFCETKHFVENAESILQAKLRTKTEKHDGARKLHFTEKILNKDTLSYLTINPKHTSDFQALVPIMTGCNNFCSYCVVPYARGRETSRPAQEIIAEVANLVKNGYKHITLLGQNVNSYSGTWNVENGAQATQKTMDFPKLLKKLNAIPGKFWLTFVSSHPKDMSDELIQTVARCKKVIEWIHLPVQAGDDTVLKNMNRRYTHKHYLGLAAKIKRAFATHKPGLSYGLTSDIIVGFPGETEEQFMQSAFLIQKAKFDMVYFGQFSPRPGTRAFIMPDDVSHEEKERRESVLNEILKKTALANNKRYIGKKVEVLVEKETSGFYFGKTRSQKNIKFSSKKKGLVGKFQTVLVKKANIWSLEG